MWATPNLQSHRAAHLVQRVSQDDHVGERDLLREGLLSQEAPNLKGRAIALDNVWQLDFNRQL